MMANLCLDSLIDFFMIPWTQLGTAIIPNNGGELKLSQRGEEFSIRLSGIRGELMNSRTRSSEEALAVLACIRIKETNKAQILIGGLGMGFTLAAALNCSLPSAHITVAELIPEVVDWNQGPLGKCAGSPLKDNRTHVYTGDVADLLRNHKNTYDAIMLDVDNGPEALTQTENKWIYSPKGLTEIFKALKPKGILTVWSANQNPAFVQLLTKAKFNVSTKTVRAHAGKGSRHTIFVAEKP